MILVWRHQWYIYIYIYVITYIYVYIYIYHTHTYIYVYIYVCVCVCVCICIYGYDSIADCSLMKGSNFSKYEEKTSDHCEHKRNTCVKDKRQTEM